MTFPTNGDYVQALQHTDVCFQDQELKASQVELTTLGMPKAISGNFASVFSVTGSSGRRYAVKCFTREVKGQDQRYTAIHETLADLARPWQVGFDYIRKGVLVDGRWHAILRMEWVENSQTLIPWLNQNVGKPDRILNVAKQFAECIEDLQQAGIAHGDLQHGNLLIDGNQGLRVIDYDGMFVTSIKDLGSNELGLANYQHPRRTGNDFAPCLDRFSAWLIYGSLLSLAAQPGLWWTFRQDGDEKLLFGKDDFTPPLDAIRRLGSLGSPHAEVADVLTEALITSNSLSAIPEFDSRRLPLPKLAPTAASAPPSAWWKQVGPQTAETTSESDPAVVGAHRLGAGWLRSHEPLPPPVEMSRPSRLAKVMGLVTTAVALLGAVALGVTFSNIMLGGLVLLTWATAITVGVGALWHRSEAVVDRNAARRRVKLATREVANQKTRVAKALSTRSALDSDERRALQNLENERSKLAQRSTTEFQRLSADLNKKLNALRDSLQKLDAAKATEAAQKLRTLQEQHTTNYLMARRIEPGVIHGIGPALVATLSVHGLRTAADIGGISDTRFRKAGSSYWFTMSGIGPAKATAIDIWHRMQLAAAASKAPTSLPSASINSLDIKYADQRRQKQVAIDAIAPQMQQIRATVDAKYAGLDREVTVQAEAVRLDYRRRRSAADGDVSQALTELQNLEDDLLDSQRNLVRYQHVSLAAFLKA